MWDPVENASQYEVFLLAFGQRSSFNRIPETFIEYDMQEFEKQIMNSPGCPILIYTCTIQAVTGRESFDGPVTHINKGFKQLPKPTNVNMEKFSNKLHISYTPITLSDNLKKDFKGYKINLCNIQSPNERLVAKSPLIEDITSGCHDFDFEDIQFEEGGNYQAKVYAITSNDQTISSFSGNSIKTMQSLLPPENVQISVKLEEPDMRILISCDFNLKTKAYILGVINYNTKKYKSKLIKPLIDSPIVKHELSLAEIREIHDSPEFAEFHAFAQSIGDKDEFDSIISNSNSVVTQFEAPKNILLELEKKQEFSITYFAPTEGAKNKTSERNDVIIIQVLNLKKDIEYIARLRKVVHDEDPARYMS
ncbi:4261_t:CDS:2, partial [Cetraspora pellucida]